MESEQHSSLPLPAGYQTVMPYLILPDAGAFIQFTREVFGARELRNMHRDDQRILHAEIQIGDCTLMLADSTDQYGAETCGLFIYVASADETYAKALAAGAHSVMDLSDQPYGRTCGIKDPFGNTWWITTANG